MTGPRMSCAALAAVAITCLACSAISAATLDTFDFTQSGWMAGNGVTGVLTGSFQGTVEASGLIEVTDLTSFSSQLALSDGTVIPFTFLVPFEGGGAPFFSYNVNGGASSLDFIAQFDLTVCVGAVAPLGCESPPTALGDVIGFAFTNQQPALTLVSSVTTGTAPEPATTGLMGLGCIVVSALAIRRWF